MGMAKYDRLLFILNLLRARKTLTAADLARECGVTERSIYRDIMTLSEANVPVYFDNGYKLASNNFLPPLNFSFEEYTTLKLALGSSPLAYTTEYRSLLKQIRAKVDAGLSELVRAQKRTAVDTTHIEISASVDTSVLERFFSRLERAIADSCCVEMEYDSIESGVTTRIVEPYFIVFRARAFYFVAYCRNREELRTFRLDRVRSLEASPAHFIRRNDVDPARYFEGSWEVYCGDSVTVQVRFTGSAARVIRLGHHHANESVVEEPDGSVRYTVEVRGPEEISRWLLGFGDEAEVLAPAELRERMRTIGTQLSRLYAPEI
jgi:proteasome accessory factor B